MDSKSFDTVVIGGGIIGCCTAYYLAREGRRVAILDPSPEGKGASYINAGYLTPSHFRPLASPETLMQGLRYLGKRDAPLYVKPRLDAEFIRWVWAFGRAASERRARAVEPVILELNQHSYTLFEALAADQRFGPFPMEKKGLLMVYRNPASQGGEARMAERARELGLAVDHWKREELLEREPAFRTECMGAFHYLDDGHVEPETFMARLNRALGGLGVTVLRGHRASTWRHKGDCITAVRTVAEDPSDKVAAIEWEGAQFVVAAGVWSPGLLTPLGIRLPVEAGTGYSFEARPGPDLKHPAILVERKVAVTPFQGRVRFAGTMELSGLQGGHSERRTAAIASAAQAYLDGSGLTERTLQEVRSGFRPLSYDGLPYIGRAGRFENLWIATGHAMMGWSLGPVTGHILNDLIAGRTPIVDPGPLRPER